MLGVRSGFLGPFPLMMPGVSLFAPGSVRMSPVRATGSGTADDPVVIQDSDEGEVEYVESDEYLSDSDDSDGSCGCPYHHHHHYGGWGSDDSDMSSDDYY
jgi:hypothetical protein